MLDPRTASPLPRPVDPSGEEGPLDERLYDRIEERFVRLIRDNPILGTAIGLHDHDDHTGLRGQAAEKPVERVEPTGGGADADYEGSRLP